MLEDYLVTFDSKKLFYKQFSKSDKPKRVLIVVHGIAEHIDRYLPFAKELMKSSEVIDSIYLFEQRGHGRSDGRLGYVNKFEDYIRDLDELIQQIKKKNPEVVIALFGHSMGGVVCIRYVQAEPGNISTIMLSAPGFEVKMKVAWWKSLLTPIVAKIWPTFSLPTNIRSVDETDDPDMRKSIELDKMIVKKVSARWFNEFNQARTKAFEKAGKIDVPILIFQAEHDPLADIEGSKKFFAKIRSRKKHFETFNADIHHLLLAKETTRKRVYKLVIEWLARL